MKTIVKTLMLTLILSFGFMGCTGGNKSSSTRADPNTLRVRMAAWPKGLNYPTVGDAYTGMLWGFTSVSLLTADPDTYDPLPYLATKWDISKDHKTFTFHLNKNAKWEDGKAITAEDVKFTIDLMWDEKRCLLCAPARGYYGPVEWTKVIDPHTFQLRVGKVHFESDQRFGSISILAKHFYEKGNFEKDYDKVIFGGGFYKYNAKASQFKKSVVMDRIENHWAREYEYFKKEFPFKKIHFKYIKDGIVAFEAFKRKDIDIFYYELDTIKYWDNQKGTPWDDPNLGVITAPMFNPSIWAGVALNMRGGVLKDINFRKSLQFLLNRKLMIEKIMNNHYRAVTGPFMTGSKYSWPTIATPFDPGRAKELLKTAGFLKAGPDGILTREITEEGKTIKQRASVKILYSMEDHAKWLTIFKEDARKVGVEIEPRMMEWSAATKLLDEFKFEGFVISWSGSPTPGPGQLFHGKTAHQKGSGNLPGLNDPKLNAAIDAAPAEFDESKRIKLYHDAEKRIIEAQPYLFRWTRKNHYVTYWKDRVNPTEKPYYKFGGSIRRDPFYTHWRPIEKKTPENKLGN